MRTVLGVVLLSYFSAGQLLAGHGDDKRPETSVSKFNVERAIESFESTLKAFKNKFETDSPVPAILTSACLESGVSAESAVQTYFEVANLASGNDDLVSMAEMARTAIVTGKSPAEVLQYRNSVKDLQPWWEKSKGNTFSTLVTGAGIKRGLPPSSAFAAYSGWPHRPGWTINEDAELVRAVLLSGKNVAEITNLYHAISSTRPWREWPSWKKRVHLSKVNIQFGNSVLTTAAAVSGRSQDEVLAVVTQIKQKSPELNEMVAMELARGLLVVRPK